MALPYCSRIFAYSTARPSAPRDTPTRSAVVITSASAYHRAAASSVMLPRSVAPLEITARVRVRSAPPRASPRAVTHTVVPSSCSALAYPRESNAESATTMVAGSTGSASRLRTRSSASTGPRNGASTRPRPNSSATMATSTPDASSDRSERQPVTPICLSSLAIRDSSARAATESGPRSSASFAAASRSCCCSLVRRTSMALLQHTAQRLARGQARDFRDENDPAGPFVRCQAPAHQGDEFVGLDLGTGAGDFNRGHHSLAVGGVGNAEHRTVLHGRVTVQHG